MDHADDVRALAAQRGEPLEALVEHAVVGVADRDLLRRRVAAGLVRRVEVLEADHAALGERGLLLEVLGRLHDRVEREVGV
jgi:hypothetical protein